MKFVPISIAPHRIIGVTADIDDEHVSLALASPVYNPFEEVPCSAPLFIHTSANPYSLSAGDAIIGYVGRPTV